jgi:DNA-binding NtrC family response regulator
MPSVLIVEDHQAVREALTEVFFRWGCSVATAVTMDEAMAHIRTGHFDLVVTDLDLGGANRLELVRLLGNSQPQMKFVVMSGRLSPKDILGSGFEAGNRLKFLKKPFLLSQLQAVVNELQNDGLPAATN